VKRLNQAEMEVGKNRPETKEVTVAEEVRDEKR